MQSIAEQELEAELCRLESLPRDDLAAEWMKAFGVPAPKPSSRSFLLKAVAHHQQVQVFGDLKPSTRETLLKLAEELRSGSSRAGAPPASARS